MKQQASAKKTAGKPVDLLAEVRSMDNLYRSWVTVRSNVNASMRKKKLAGSKPQKMIQNGQQSEKDIFSEVQQISKNPFPYLRKIQTELQKGTFAFEKQKAVPIPSKKRGKPPRPIVVSPLKNRIVQRATLNVLQKKAPSKIVAQLGFIPEVLRTPTSVGGIPERGIQHAMKLIQQEIDAGATHYIRSDIRQFFVTVSKQAVVDFIRQQTQQDPFADFFHDALKTELANEEEIKELIHLFPVDDTGVPQGSSLSALAGNIVLKDFDRQMNGRGIVMIRYIDDFVIIGRSQASVEKAFVSARCLLQTLGMKAYGPEDGPEKATTGLIKDGFDFLGCHISANAIYPSSKSSSRIIETVSADLTKSLERIKERMRKGLPRRADEAYIQTLNKVDRKIRGWGDGYAFCTNRFHFQQMDKKFSDLLKGYRLRFNNMLKNQKEPEKTRAFGVALLIDTEQKNLKDIK